VRQGTNNLHRPAQNIALAIVNPWQKTGTSGYATNTDPPNAPPPNTYVSLWRGEAELDEGDLGVLDARRRPARVRCRVRQQQTVRKLRVVNRASDPIGGKRRFSWEFSYKPHALSAIAQHDLCDARGCYEIKTHWFQGKDSYAACVQPIGSPSSWVWPIGNNKPLS
jgi:hypothetical protein